MMEVRNSGAESQSLDRSQSIQKPDGDVSKIDGAQVAVVVDAGVKVDVGNAGGVAPVAKRKRGRPPKAQANQPSAKKSKEEDEDEDVCFICFDGGSLVLCDRRGCPKAYHHACIKRDEAFFQSKAKWTCGWHICSICEKAAHHMCFTCTYSLCKSCIKKSDFVCARGDKGFCTVCMKTIMLIENSAEATGKVDFDDKSSWEYLFKVYWLYIKGKLSITRDELTQAKNPWKQSITISTTESHVSASGRRSITLDTSFGNLESSESKRQKTYDETNGLPKEWASRELLDFVSHMKNGDTSVLSQFDVQALLLEYIKRNNLRDPQKKTQIICDLRLMNLFGKPRVGHIEMLKLLEFHFLIKENMVNRKGGEQRTIQNKLDEYAAIDVHNMNLIYLRRNLMEKLIEDKENFHEKVVGSIVQIRISGSDQKDDMYRLVQVVGTSKVDVAYKIGEKLVDVMLEVSNLDKKEIVSIDTISNQELSEDDCRRLRESIRCGLVRCFTVGEIQEKAMALRSILLDDKMETEIERLNQFCDRATGKGQKKGLRESVQKLKLLKMPEERERRLREIPEVHSDPKMNPDYESDDTEEYFNNEHGEHPKPKFPWVSGTNSISSQKRPESQTAEPKELGVTTNPNREGSGKPKDESVSEKTKTDVECNGSKVKSASESTSMPGVNEDRWYYRDPSGNVQGPFSMVQLQRWSTSGYFPHDMKVWATREADLVLLNDALREHFGPQKIQTTTIPSSTIPAIQSSTIPAIQSSTIPAIQSSTISAISSSAIPVIPSSISAILSSTVPAIPSSAVPLTSISAIQSSTIPSSAIPSSTVRATRSSTVHAIPSSSTSAIPSSSISAVQSSTIPSSAIPPSTVRATRSSTLHAISSPPIPATSHAQNSLNLEKVPDPPIVTPLTKKKKSKKPSNTRKLPVSTPKEHDTDINPHVSSSPIPAISPPPIPATTSYAQNSIQLPDSSIQSSWGASSYNLNHHPPTVAHLTKTNKSTEPFNIRNIPGSTQTPDINQHVSSPPIPATTSYALNSVNLEKIPDHAGQSSTQNWSASNYNLNHNPPIVTPLTKTNKSTEPFDIRNIPGSTSKENNPDINRHISSVFTVADAALVDLPSPLPKKEIHKNDAGNKEQLVQDPVNHLPSWSTALSLVVGGAQLEETGQEWGRYPVKPEEWESKPLEVLDHQVATTNTNINQIMHSSSPPHTTQPYNSLPAWHGLGLGETIEFSTLAEESVSDLLAEVDAMESRNGVPSPTSRRNRFLEDLFNGSIDDFSPTGEQGTRSDGFSSSVDIRRSTGLQQFSFGLETKTTCVGSGPQVTNSDNLGFKWADMGGSEPPPRQDMIDLNDSTRAEADDDLFEEKVRNRSVVMAEAHGGRKSKGGGSGGREKAAKVAGTKPAGRFPDSEDEFIQPEVAPPPPPSQPLPPLLPLPSPPPTKLSQGPTSTGRVHAHTGSSRSGNVGRDSHHRRSSGGGGDRDRDKDRYNSISPRDRTHHVEDSGHSRSSRASWSRQSSFSGGGGGGSGYSRPPSKGPPPPPSKGPPSKGVSPKGRICKFYESGRCKKGSACSFLHPQDR